MFRSRLRKELDIYDTFKQKLESVGHFAPRDEIEYADRINDVQRRASEADNLLAAASADESAIAVATPVDDKRHNRSGDGSTDCDPQSSASLSARKRARSVRWSSGCTSNNTASKLATPFLSARH